MCWSGKKKRKKKQRIKLWGSALLAACRRMLKFMNESETKRWRSVGRCSISAVLASRLDLVSVFAVQWLYIIMDASSLSNSSFITMGTLGCFFLLVFFWMCVCVCDWMCAHSCVWVCCRLADIRFFCFPQWGWWLLLRAFIKSKFKKNK